MDDKYVPSFAEFMKDHPEIKSDWKPFIEPFIQSSEDQLINFILGYIFM